MKYSADSDQTPAVLDQPSTEKWDRQSLKTRLISILPKNHADGDK